PIVREPDGLAMSSRNAYLDSSQRKQALVLARALRAVEARVRAGEISTNGLVNAAKAIFAKEPEVRVDYIAVVDPDTLDPVNDVANGALIAVAAYVGSTRLIDNVVIEPKR